ncbi:MAG TPA: zinc ribbon domain-containing protein [Acidobacteriaceae bacterium]
MPLYEYKCVQCHRHTEKIQKFSDPEITECPHCGGQLERVISAPAVSFKGGGWYADGYGNAKPSASKGESKSDSGSISASSAESTSSSNKEGSGASTSGSTQSTTAPAAPSSAPSSDKK